MLRVRATAFILLPVCVLLFINGCNTSTVEMQQRAGQLAAKVGDYRKQQANRIDKYNSDYRETFTRLMATFAELTKQELQQGRDADDQAIADSLIVDFKDAALRGKFRLAFASAVQQQEGRMQDTDNAVATARSTYLQGYQQLVLSVGDLDKVQTDLQLLAAKENGWKNAEDLIQSLYKAYQEAKNNADAGKQ